MIPLILQYGIGAIVGHELYKRFNTSSGVAIKHNEPHPHHEHYHYTSTGNNAVKRIEPHSDHCHYNPQRQMFGANESRIQPVQQQQTQTQTKSATQSNSVINDVLNK